MATIIQYGPEFRNSITMTTIIIDSASSYLKNGKQPILLLYKETVLNKHSKTHFSIVYRKLYIAFIEQRFLTNCSL
jgi:hypothetical protein